MQVNVKPSDQAPIVAVINPQSTTGTLTSSWIDAGLYGAIYATIYTGTLGASATVDAVIQQATDGSGTGAKSVTGSAITQLTQAGGGSNKQVAINLYPEALDLANGFRYVRLSITIGTAASSVAGVVQGIAARYQPASPASSVAQTVTVTG